MQVYLRVTLLPLHYYYSSEFMCPSPLPYFTPLSPFLPYVSFVSIMYFASAFIAVYATHIVPLPLSCSHLILIQQLVPNR